ncbi:hypothetical protein G9G63_10095 [Paenibacillus sp. EKM202P]|uniref:hypothetical protein n=1 Tax=unclassified Paenibacillus TaxID=185978 RepID=UPI0013EC0FDF|nr:MULTISPECIES: hypothetical protein [unclassified Paenibacillus]KAF6564486.1 hypothetical protein G9G63_10095 [Paenibacillus sp. EKM202P]KAF6571699.1 hypothetical protein G9G64_06680 [Paenibacillus sp. EKM207P]
MRLIFYTLSFAVIFMLVGCGQSEFEKNMNQGKEYLKSKQYSSAIDSFNNALIDNPSSSDAKTLLEKAKEDQIDSTMKEKLTQYMNENKMIVLKFVLERKQQKIEDLTVEKQDEKLHRLIDIQEEERKLISKYQDYKSITDTHEKLLESIAAAIDLQSDTVTLMKYLADKPNDYQITDEKASEAQANLKTNSDLSNEKLKMYTNYLGELQTKYEVDISEKNEDVKTQ